MKSPDVVFDQLGKLYDFYREISSFKLKVKQNSNKAGPPDQESVLALFPAR